uniref:Ribosomal protein S2 n=1 Tax=Nitzschia sp. IriIs04 TaxID=1444690 RepID=A0A0S3QPM9_9STRA|nr:ribosomal protein S2 [Nitzschia sp. IriIs04]BAT70267.1 ribosomal protein S2 [Nitzschia sp. IriIs04]
MNTFSLNKLLKSKIHLGHHTNELNPNMLPYIYKEKNGIHIIDVIKSFFSLNQACNFLTKISKQSKKIILIGTNKDISKLIAKEAKKANLYYINSYWSRGILTNFSSIKHKIIKLKKLEQQKKNGFFSKLSKKETIVKNKKLNGLYKRFNGIRAMTKIPDVAIILNQKYDLNAILECKKMNIPIISIIDSNCDPNLIDIKIPGNDDSIKSINFILQFLIKNLYFSKPETK